MIARDSFEKSLPRFASAAPFLCLIEDHLLCPDTRHLLEEQFVQPRVVRQLRMERRDVLDPRRPDEDGPQRPLLAGQLEVGLERRHLPAEGVSPYLEVDEAEVV